MAGRVGSADGSWLEHQLADTPLDLAARTREFLALARGETQAARLADAARRALDAAIAQSPERRAALDLLAADALVTLALAAAVEEDPDRLEAFAASLQPQASSRVSNGGEHRV